MTREKAINLIGGMKSDLSDFYDDNDLTALDMAISALSEQESLKERMEKLYLVESLKEDFENLTKENERLRNALSENKGEWIPVSERLPEKNVWVLVTVEKSGKCFQEIMRRSNYFEAWIDDIDYYTDEIIAWQPLPEPYNAESEDK